MDFFSIKLISSLIKTSDFDYFDFDFDYDDDDVFKFKSSI